jgi:hypothetical protein
MMRGSCLCGSIKYQINGRLFDALNCHCTMCRKAHGAAFRSRATVKAVDFEWLQGEAPLLSMNPRQEITEVFAGYVAPRS